MTSQKWIESMERMTTNVSIIGFSEPQLVSDSSKPRFYRLNHECADWKTMVDSIIKFLKEEKFIFMYEM
jgi:hypothetical protein